MADQPPSAGTTGDGERSGGEGPDAGPGRASGADEVSGRASGPDEASGRASGPDEAPGREPDDGAPRRPRRSAGRNLPLAVASGVALAGALLGALAWHPLAVLLLVAGLVVVALLELDVAFRSAGVRPATPVTVGAGLVMLLGAFPLGADAQVLGLLLLVFGAVVWTFLGTPRERVVATVSATLLMGLWVPFLASHLALLVARDDGAWLVLAVIVLAVANDIGAYGVGLTLGRRPMAPSISPAKTWEGAAGGLALALVVAAAAVAWMPGLVPATALLLAVAVVPAAILGDLAESLVKRDLGVKDLGRVLPGHGGIMDRVDSILFALPAAHLVLVAVGV